MDAKEQAKILIKTNEAADNTDITLMIPQNINAGTVKNALITLLEHIIRFEYEKIKEAEAAEAAKKAEAVTPEIVNG